MYEWFLSWVVDPIGYSLLLNPNKDAIIKHREGKFFSHQIEFSEKLFSYATSQFIPIVFYN